jgi:type II secretory pathway component PulC
MACVGLSALLWRQWQALDVPQTCVAEGKASELAWPDGRDLSALNWTLVQRAAPVLQSESGPLGSRYRLAGTFIEYAASRELNLRKAILDDLLKGGQRVVREGEQIEEMKIAAVYLDHVVLETSRGKTELWLSFRRPTGTQVAAPSGTATNALPLPGETRFGTQQVGPSRWVFRREPLMKYYNELMDNPDRLVKVFDSMKPVYVDGGKISGYQLDVEGEGEFFDACGLRQGDIVHSVNSLEMSSRARAEHFIKQFVENKANAFVFEVERGGVRQKMVHQVR